MQNNHQVLCPTHLNPIFPQFIAGEVKIVAPGGTATACIDFAPLKQAPSLAQRLEQLPAGEKLTNIVKSARAALETNIKMWPE